MLLKRFEIHNFKSLRNFRMDLAHCVALIGLNGSGKSTILQAMDFVFQMVRPGALGGWFGSRGWEFRSDILCGFNLSKSREARTIKSCLVLESGKEQYQWEGDFSLYDDRMIHEKVIRLSDSTILLSVKDNQLIINGVEEKITINYKGSIMAQYLFEGNGAHKELAAIRDFLREARSLELLSPLQMRKRVRGEAEDIGLSGERLSAFLGGLASNKREHLAEQLRAYFPHLEKLWTRRKPGGAQQLYFREKYEGEPGSLGMNSQHASDGLLRLLAILAQASATPSCMLIDEIEDGFNPEIIHDLVHYLMDECSAQIVMTTHSPLILNFIPDEEAKKSVKLIYKNDRGETGAFNFFDLEEPKKKLGILGPGEVMVDVDLAEMSRIAAQREAAA